MSLDMYRKKILSQFGLQDVIKYSIAGPGIYESIKWEELETNVRQWWLLYEEWEKRDTVAKAYHEQRLTVKGAHLQAWEKGVQASPVLSETPRQLGETREWERSDEPAKQYLASIANLPEDQRELLKPYWSIRKDLKSIQERFDPKMFVPEEGEKSQKTEWGLHDLSAGLMHKNKPISKQQYKTPSRGQYFVFMPLSHAGDQAVFQNINRLAKEFQTRKEGFYNLVRDIRSKMTRIKLAAEHDMATNFVMVARPGTDPRPKFKFTLIDKTDVSIRDKEKGLLPPGVEFPDGKKVVQIPTTPEILQARQLAAINFQSLVLGELHSYGEVVVAYRRHLGEGESKFPKFAEFDAKNQLWKVGKLGGTGYNWQSTGETFPDQPPEPVG